MEEISVGSVVLLFNVHTSPYFKEKVFTSKSYWEEIEDHEYFTGIEWKHLVTQLNLVRDSPSMEIYEERERELLEMTKDLTIRPGQTVNSVLFKDYYLKNWKESAFRWVKVFRKSLPTEGVNDTQAAESTFAFIET